MAKYQWKSQQLKKKSSTYTNIMLLTMAIVLACLFLLPENLKVVNLPIIGIAGLFWYLSYRTQTQDKKIVIKGGGKRQSKDD